MSYVMTRMVPLTPAVADWAMYPVPTWGAHPMTAGPQRVGVGCASGCKGAGAVEDPYKQVGWGYVAAAGAIALVAGVLLGYAAAHVKTMAPNKKRKRSKVWTANARVSKLSTARRAKLPSSAFIDPERRAWPIHDRPHAIKALQYAKWPQHRSRRPAVLSAVAAEWGHDPTVRAKFEQYFPRTAAGYLGGRKAAA